jgi:hypothetical protein
VTWRTSCSRRRQKIFKCKQGTGAILHYAAAGQRWLRPHALCRRQPLCCPLRMARRVQRWRFVLCLELCCVVLAFFVKQIYCCQLQILLVATTALHKSEASATGSPCAHTLYKRLLYSPSQLVCYVPVRGTAPAFVCCRAVIASPSTAPLHDIIISFTPPSLHKAAADGCCSRPNQRARMENRMRTSAAGGRGGRVTKEFKEGWVGWGVSNALALVHDIPPIPARRCCWPCTRVVTCG